MSWHDRTGPRPPSWRTVEKQLQRHVGELMGPSPLCLDPHNRPPLVPLLLAHRDWRLAGHLPPPHRAPKPTPEVMTGVTPARGGGHLGLRLAIVLTFHGDLGTMFAAVSVVVNVPLPVTALLVLVLATAGLFLAHQVGCELRLRHRGLARMPAVLVALRAVVWLCVGLVAALLRLAAPLSSAGGFAGVGPSNAAAVSVLLAGLHFVLHIGTGLAVATLGFRTGDPEGGRLAAPGTAGRLRARSDRRRQVASARIDAYFRVLAADTALKLAAGFRDPATTDFLTASVGQERPR